MIVNMQHTLKLVKESMQRAREWAKFYVEKNQSPTTYEVNGKMFLIIKPLSSDLRLRKCPKFSPQYCEPFSILKTKKQSGLSINFPKKMENP
jgi:hypothetical protein